MVLYNPLVRVPEFLAGVALGRLFALAQHRTEGVARWPPWAAPAAALGLVCGLAISASVPYAVRHNGLLDPLCALLIYTLAWGHGPLAAWLAHPRVVLLGEASYGL